MQTSQIYLNKLIWAVNLILKSVTRNFILLNTMFSLYIVVFNMKLLIILLIKPDLSKENYK